MKEIPNEEKSMKNVKIGQSIDAYHDGKISPDRLSVVVVDDIIPRGELSKQAQNHWRKALREDIKDVFDGQLDATQQFWDWNCDEFIVGHILNEKDQILFAKRPNGFGWHGVNWNYKLDVGGSCRKKNLKTWRECAKEIGWTMKWNAKVGQYDYIDMKTGKKVEL